MTKSNHLLKHSRQSSLSRKIITTTFTSWHSAFCWNSAQVRPRQGLELYSEYHLRSAEATTRYNQRPAVPMGVPTRRWQAACMWGIQSRRENLLAPAVPKGKQAACEEHEKLHRRRRRRKGMGAAASMTRRPDHSYREWVSRQDTASLVFDPQEVNEVQPPEMGPAAVAWDHTRSIQATVNASTSPVVPINARDQLLSLVTQCRPSFNPLTSYQQSVEVVAARSRLLAELLTPSSTTTPAGDGFAFTAAAPFAMPPTSA